MCVRPLYTTNYVRKYQRCQTQNLRHVGHALKSEAGISGSCSLYLQSLSALSSEGIPAEVVGSEWAIEFYLLCFFLVEFIVETTTHVLR